MGRGSKKCAMKIGQKQPRQKPVGLEMSIVYVIKCAIGLDCCDDTLFTFRDISEIIGLMGPEKQSTCFSTKVLVNTH